MHRSAQTAQTAQTPRLEESLEDLQRRTGSFETTEPPDSFDERSHRQGQQVAPEHEVLRPEVLTFDRAQVPLQTESRSASGVSLARIRRNVVERTFTPYTTYTTRVPLLERDSGKISRCVFLNHSASRNEIDERGGVITTEIGSWR